MSRQRHNNGGQARVALLAGVLLLYAASAAISQTNELRAQTIQDMNNHGVGFGNGSILPRDGKTATLKFDISFNAFRQDLSHNAVWIFFKVRPEGGAEWQHVRLAADKVMNPTGYGCAQANAPVDLMVPAGLPSVLSAEAHGAKAEAASAKEGEDGFTGLFLRLADHHPGLWLAASGVTAVWDLTACKDITRDTKVEMRAFAIRMMYIPKGPYWLGSGGREMFGFYRYTDGKQDVLPFQVTGAGAIPTGKKEGMLWARGSEPEDGGEIPAAFPNGYAAFYCMENPVDGVPFAAYLNTLTREQAYERFAGDTVTRDERVVKDPVTGAVTVTNCIYVGQNRQKSNGVWDLSYLDGALYSAWAGLRPMTELEYEKTLRGFRDPLPDEAGYSYWGINYGGGIYNGQPRMRVVAVNAAAGRNFKGTHGTGMLELPADWPMEDAVGIATRGGWGAPGVGFQDTFRTSDRHMSDADAERRAGYSWRCARTAPVEAEWNTARGEPAEAVAKSGK